MQLVAPVDPGFSHFTNNPIYLGYLLSIYETFVIRVNQDQLKNYFINTDLDTKNLLVDAVAAYCRTSLTPFAPYMEVFYPFMAYTIVKIEGRRSDCLIRSFDVCPITADQIRLLRRTVV